jgi:hypothetical protein
MPRIRVPLTSFDYGEVSNSLRSRTDTNVYSHAAEKVRNFFIRSEGGLEKRFGTKPWATIGLTPSGSATRPQVRLEPFIFSDDEKYIVSFEAGKILVFQLDPSSSFNPTLVQTITQTTTSVNLPWSQSEVEQLTYAQSGDVMFIAHTKYPTVKLVRTGLTSFQVEYFAFETSTDGNTKFQPYHAFHDTGVTIACNGTTGSGKTLTTSASHFVSGHVGTTFLIGETDVEITAVASGTSATGTIKGTLRQQLQIDALETVEGSDKVLVTHALHGLAPSASITIDRAAAVGGISASNINGSRTVAEVLDENTYEITAASSASSSAIGGGSPRIATGAATTEWAEQSYSAVRGYPAAVTFHEGRLWFAGSQAQPSHLWASKSNRFFNFDVGDGDDDDSIDLSAGVGSFNQIRHLVSNRDLQVFTNEAEFFVPAFTTSPVTPATAQVRRQTPFGSSFVTPRPFDGATSYVQSTGNAVREYIFSDSEGAYVSTDISVLSSHLVVAPFQQTITKGALSKPESFAFFVNSDGSLAVFYSMRADKKAGWSLWETDGKFQSIASIGDRLFCVVERDNGSGSQAFYLEELQESMPMDYCNLYSGSNGVFSVSSNFANGAKVKVVSGTDFLGEYTVASGNVDVSALEPALSSAYIGYSFTPILQTLPLDAEISNGPLTGQPRRVASVILDLNETLSVSVNDTDLLIRNVNDDFSTDRTAVTGKKEFFVLGFSRDPFVTISQSVPLSLQINGMVVEVAF